MNKSGILQLLTNNTSDNTFKPNTLFSDNTGNSDIVTKHDEEQKKIAIEQGYRDGIKKAEQEWNDRLALLDNLCESLMQPIKEVDEIIQEKSVELSIAIAKQIIRRELSLDSGQIVSAIKQAIDLIPKDGETINLHINPKDMQYVNQIFSNDDVSNKYNIVQDPSIAVGGCKALTDYSLVDLTIDKQVANITAQIFGDQRNATK